MKCKFTKSLLVAMFIGSGAHAVDTPFDVPWIGYSTALYPEGLFPFSSQSADFDGDGVPDLATVSIGGTAWLSVLRGDGEGGYLPADTYPLTLESMDLAVADFDGDGDIDIVTADTGRFLEGNTVSLYLNDGTGGFAFSGAFSIGNTGPSGIVAADFDGDGWVDVATANDAYIVCNNTVSVLRNNVGNGFSFAQVYTISSCTNEIDAGDVNGDGAVDLVIAHEQNVYTIMDNDQEGGFVARPTTPGIVAGSIPQDPIVHLADVDLDGDVDIFFSNRDSGGVGAGAIGLWRNDGKGGFGPAETLSFEWHNGGGIDITTADVTGDNWPDVLVATGSEGNWFLFESDAAGGFGTPRKLRAGHTPSAIDTPDLDGDGDLDVVVIGAQSLEACVYLNPGDGSFVQPPVIDFADPALAPVFITNIEAADIDGDGDLDLVCGFRSDFSDVYGTTVRRNLGDGTFGVRETYVELTYAEYIRLRDVDNDGDPDLIWIENDGRFRMRFNDGTGTFGNRVNMTTIGIGRYFDLYDIDGDGDLDITAATGFEVAVIRNNGSGTFGAPTYAGIGGFFSILAMADYDADGHLDVLTDSAPQGYPQVSFGNGTGSFGPAFTVSTGRGVRSFGIADFDQDGNVDFGAIYNLDEKGLSIRRGRDDGNFFVPQHYHGSFQWGDYTVGGRTEIVDVDGDGHLDVLFANVLAQDFSYWRGRGDGTFEPLRRFGAGHNVSDLVAGDFNGDGVIDVAMATQADAGRWWYTAVVIIEGRAPGVLTPGDIDGDGTVSFADLVALLSAWGPCGAECPADLDGDGAVGFADLLIVLTNWS